MNKLSTLILSLCASVLIMAVPLNGRERLTIRVSPTVAFAPAFLSVQARIEADTDNRALEVVAESGEFYRSSLIPLDGLNAPPVSTFEFRSLPPGYYEVSGTLVGASGRRAIVTQFVRVVPSPGSDR